MRLEAAFEGGEKPLVAVQVDGDLGDQDKVGDAAGQRGRGGDEPGVAAHEFDQSDAVEDGLGLDVGAVDDPLGFGDGGGVAEGAVAVFDVVVDGFGDPDDGDGEVAAGDFEGDLMGPALGAVAADAEEDVDGLALEEIDAGAGFLVAAGGPEDRAPFVVDVVDEIAGEFERGRPSAGFSPW